MRTVYPNKIQSFGVYDYLGAVGAANYSKLSDAVMAFGKPGLLDRVVGDLIPIVEENAEDVLVFGTNFIKLTLDEEEHLQRIPYKENATIKNKICTIFGGWTKNVNKDFFGYTGKTPHFYKIFEQQTFGPYSNDIEIKFNGSVNDSLFIYSGSNPNNPDKIFEKLDDSYYVIPANTKFHINVKNESEPASYINGLFEFISIQDSINLKQLVDKNDNKIYYLYSYNLSAPNIKTKVGEYEYSKLPVRLSLDSALCYEFGSLEVDYSETESEVINFYLTLHDTFSEYSRFTKIPAEYVLLSERIFIDKNNVESSWYTWNKNICTIKHNLNGLIDFNIRNKGINELINIPHRIVDRNTLEIDFSNYLTGSKTVLLSDFTSDSNNDDIKLPEIIQFQLFDLAKTSKISFCQYTEDSPDNWSLKLVDEFTYENLPETYKFEKDIRYRIYATTNVEDTLNQFFELIVWRVDDLKSKWKRNVFTLQQFSKDEVDWAVYDNEDQLTCDLPFRFSILGYSKIHEFAGSDVIDTTTVNTNLAIEPTYQFNIKNDKIKVLVPNFESKDQCHSIYFYVSLLSKSINCVYKENNQYAEWSSFHGADGYEIQTVKITHNMNGIVKTNIRDTRFERYDTYILDNNTIQIVFKEPWKYDINNFNVDFYLIKRAE